MWAHPLTNFEIQKSFQNEPKLNGVCSRTNAYVIILHEYRSIGNHWS